MTRVSVEGQRVEADITAEQVVAYLLATGWTEDAVVPGASYRAFCKSDEYAAVPVVDRRDSPLRMRECIEDIARAESRPAEQVAADIAGPAVGVGGVGCERPLTADEWWAGQMRPLCRATETCNRAAPRAPEVE